MTSVDQHHWELITSWGMWHALYSPFTVDSATFFASWAPRDPLSFLPDCKLTYEKIRETLHTMKCPEDPKQEAWEEGARK